MKINFKFLITFLFLFVFAFSSSLCIQNKALARIDRQEAKRIALHHAGVAPQHATFDSVELKRGRHHDTFEIEFYTHNREYEYTIRASDGKILDFSQEKRDNRHNHKPEGKRINQDEAIRIALRHANVSPREATFQLIEFERSRNIDTYEIDFYTHEAEYEYTINAHNGNVMEFSKESRGHRPPSSSSNIRKQL